MNDNRSAKAWYRHPLMWLVIAPPVGSVIAGIITFTLILRHPDPVLDTSHPALKITHVHTVNSVMPPTD